MTRRVAMLILSEVVRSISVFIELTGAHTSNPAVSPFVTVEDYLAGEAESTIKHEYLDGEVFRRHANGWLLQPVPEDSRLQLRTLDFACTMNAIYEDVTLEPVGDEPDGEPLTKVV